MDHLLIGSVIAFLITYSAIPIIIRVAEKKHLFDVPDDDRKVHANPIPSLGGIGIFSGFILGFLIAVPASVIEENRRSGRQFHQCSRRQGQFPSGACWQKD